MCFPSRGVRTFLDLDCAPELPKNPASTSLIDDGNDLKAIGKKKMTNIDISTLNPVWSKKFVMMLPPKAVLSAIMGAHKPEAGPINTTELTEEEHLAAVAACEFCLVVDVLDADRFSKEVFLGRVVLPVHALPSRDAVTKWHPLVRRGPKDKVKPSVCRSPCLVCGLLGVSLWQVKGDIRLQCVLIPPDPTMAAEQYQALMAPPEHSLKGTEGAKPKDRISELAKAKPKTDRKRRESDGENSRSDADDDDKPKFLRAMSRRQRVVAPPPKVDYSKVQAKTVSRTAKVHSVGPDPAVVKVSLKHLCSLRFQSSLSPVRRGGAGERSKISKVQIDVSSGIPVPFAQQTPLREPLYAESRVPLPSYVLLSLFGLRGWHE
jgi:hypothetical protein